MRQVVVHEDMTLAAAVANAGDHRGVVQRIGEGDQAGQDLLQRRQGRLVADIARGEQKRRFLLVPIGQFGFEIDGGTGRAGNVACAARAGGANNAKTSP